MVFKNVKSQIDSNLLEPIVPINKYEKDKVYEN